MATTKEQLIELLRREIGNEDVLQAISRVPRELFVPPEIRHLAYENTALPIDEGQTISQPYIVALMTASLELTGTEKILEVGTGSGYQAAILAELGLQVVSVERHPLLMQKAKSLLEGLGYIDIQVHLAGESMGWAEGGLYDAIMVTAASPIVPQELLDQLVNGGSIVIPVGPRHEQNLLKVTKNGDSITRTQLGGCRFVPLIGKGAWESGY